MAGTDAETRAQVERILQSEALRSSKVLRDLFSFLAEKSLSGQADELKEYSLAIDALGKPSTYDPRHDSTVRIQIGRLRQKLAEYYRSEGRDDSILIELPKRKFVLSWRAQTHSRSSDLAGTSETAPRTVRWPRTLAVVVAILIAVTAWACYSTFLLWHDRKISSLFMAEWSPELQALWERFLTPTRPLLLAISTPLFVRVPDLGYFRDSSLNREEGIAGAPRMEAVQKALHAPVLLPTYNYASVGEVTESFMLGKLLATRKTNVSLVSSRELSWRQLADNNVVFLGPQIIFHDQMKGALSDRQELMQEPQGIRNEHPNKGEPSIFLDDYKEDWVDGMAFALISHLPGPLGNGDILYFSSVHNAGRIAAVQWLCQTDYARKLLKILRNDHGQTPRYFQVLLKVRFHNGVPQESSYVLHRELPIAP